MAVIDPPFITKEVWQKYTEAVNLLFKKDENDKIVGNLLCSTLQESKEFMKELLDVEPIAFKPSIPNLPYQYNFYTNYEDPALNELNAEIPVFEDN